MSEFVSIAAFNFPPEAQLLRSRLESEGIDCFVTNEGVVGITGLGFPNEVELLVREADAPRAREIYSMHSAPDLEGIEPDFEEIEIESESPEDRYGLEDAEFEE